MVADALGLASTSVTVTAVGGAVTVTGATPGGGTAATFHLFGRRLTAAAADSLLALQISNRTSAVPAQVPYVVLLSFPGSPTLSTFLGPLCIDPSHAIGAPSLSKVYSVPTGLFTGKTISFQAVGLDPVSGWFRTNCAQQQF